MNIVQITILPNAVYRFNAIFIKIPIYNDKYSVLVRVTIVMIMINTITQTKLGRKEFVLYFHIIAHH